MIRFVGSMSSGGLVKIKERSGEQRAERRVAGAESGERSDRGGGRRAEWRVAGSGAWRGAESGATRGGERRAERRLTRRLEVRAYWRARAQARFRKPEMRIKSRARTVTSEKKERLSEVR